jgi:hypothetical protein
MKRPYIQKSSNELFEIIENCSSLSDLSIIENEVKSRKKYPKKQKQLFEAVERKRAVLSQRGSDRAAPEVGKAKRPPSTPPVFGSDPKSKTLKEIMNCYELFKLERFRKNAVRGNDLKLADFIGQRMRDLCSLNLDSEDELSEKFDKLIDGYETVLSMHNVKTTYATYSRRKIGEVGIIQFLKDLLARDDKTYGLELLRKYECLDVAYENLVLDNRFQKYFTEKEIFEAELRLARARAS